MGEEKSFTIVFNRGRGEKPVYPPLTKVFYSADDAVRFIRKYKLRIVKCNGDHQMSLAISRKLESWLGGRKQLADYLILGVLPNCLRD